MNFKKLLHIGRHWSIASEDWGGWLWGVGSGEWAEHSAVVSIGIKAGGIDWCRCDNLGKIYFNMCSGFVFWGFEMP